VRLDKAVPRRDGVARARRGSRRGPRPSDGVVSTRWCRSASGFVVNSCLRCGRASPFGAHGDEPTGQLFHDETIDQRRIPDISSARGRSCALGHRWCIPLDPDKVAQSRTTAGRTAVRQGEPRPLGVKPITWRGVPTLETHESAPWASAARARTPLNPVGRLDDSNEVPPMSNDFPPRHERRRTRGFRTVGLVGSRGAERRRVQSPCRVARSAR
jgi:hypothetical protein